MSKVSQRFIQYMLESKSEIKRSQVPQLNSQEGRGTRLDQTSQDIGRVFTSSCVSWLNWLGSLVKL